MRDETEDCTWVHQPMESYICINGVMMSARDWELRNALSRIEGLLGQIVKLLENQPPASP